MPAKILKKAERFSEKKLRASLKKVRAVPKATKAAVEAVKMKVGKAETLTTAEIKRIVSGVLRRLDPRALKKYVSFKKK